MAVDFFYPAYEVVRNQDRCITCRVCERQCANKVHQYDAELGLMISDESACVNCQRCVSLCPTRALKIVKTDNTFKDNVNYTAQGDAVSIYDPYLDMVHTYSIGIDSLQYVFMENLLREEYGHMGDYGDTIFCVEDGDFLVIAYGEYTEGQYSTDYKWMDQPVSEREYEQKLRAAFPIEDASYAFDETMSREEMLSLLE